METLTTPDFDAGENFHRWPQVLPDGRTVLFNIFSRQLQQAALLRAVYSPGQLYEIMVYFWTNHFNIDQNKEDCAWLKTVDDREVKSAEPIEGLAQGLLTSFGDILGFRFGGGRRGGSIVAIFRL